MRAILILLLIPLRTNAESLECVDSQAIIGRCLRPLLDVWEAIRESEHDAQNLLFPVLFYSKKAIHRLCASYISSMDSCSREPSVIKCEANLLMMFVESHLKFFCGKYGPIYLDNYSCISESLSRSYQCKSHIIGVPNPIQNSGKCEGMSTFFDCVKSDLDEHCGQLATVLLRRSVEGLGCLDATSEGERQLKQSNITELLTEQHRRDYFKSAQKMELKEDPTASAPARDADDYPKMPEIAFDNDTINGSAGREEKMHTTTSLTVSSTDGITTSSESPLVNKHLSRRTVDTVTEVSVERFNGSSPSLLNTTLIGLESDDNMESTTHESEPETTEFVITTTTHPPFCIPYRDHPTISRCHKSLMAKLSAIAKEFPDSVSVRFPLFNVSIETLVGLCDDFGDAKKCMDGVERLCRHPLLEFFNQQFTPTCTLLRMRDFDIDYSCIQRKLITRDDCVAKINGTIHPDNKCTGHEGFLSCIRKDLEEVCGEESFNSVVTMIRGYGCNVSDDIEAENITTKASTTRLPVKTTTNTLRQSTYRTSTPIISTTPIPPTVKMLETHGNDIEGSGEETKREGSRITHADTHISLPQSNTVENTAKNLLETDSIDDDEELLSKASTPVATHINQFREGLTPSPSETTTSKQNDDETSEESENDDPSFNYTISSNCTKPMRAEARICIAPLMRTWAALRATWPHLNEVTFPVYKYSRVDLLELCDNYANVFLCANIDNIRLCIRDELVRFAQDHLGYICSPQNIQRFMTHYDCIMEQEAMGRGNCRRHIMGEAMPGKDEHKCRGVKAYRACLAPQLKKHCHPGALSEFDSSVRQFGCLRYGLSDI
ncbi:hypothetical protein V3C99_015175 [Haemonchus contortus]